MEKKLKKQEELREDKSSGLLFVVGETYGNVELLEKAIEEIEDSPLARNDHIVFMGNFISDEHDTKEYLDLLKWYSEERKGQVTLLRASNDHRFAIGKSSFFPRKFWLHILNCYRSFDTSPFRTSTARVDVKHFLEHREFVDSFKCYYKGKKSIIVPSGLNPDRPFRQQVAMSFMFIKDIMYKMTKPYEKTIIHAGKGKPVGIVELDWKTMRFDIGSGSVKNQVVPLLILNEEKDPFIKQISYIRRTGFLKSDVV